MSSPSNVSVVGFLDVDGYECQLWQRERPWTKNQPCIVVNSSGRVVAVSPEAKKLGISRTNTPNERDMKRLFPDANVHIFRKPNEFGKPDSRKTRYGTWELLDAVKHFCASAKDIVVELASSDELYLDLSGEVTRGVEGRKASGRYKFIDIDEATVLELLFRGRTGPFRYNLSESAHAWRRHVARDEERLIFGAVFMRALANHLQCTIGISTSSGVATNRLLAKIGGGLNKPGKTTILSSLALKRVANSVELSDIPGLGGKLGQKLMDAFGIKTVGELQKITLEKLEAVDGIQEMATRIFSWARGKDNTPVIEKQMKNSIRCNIPSNPVVSTLRRLEESLCNLSAEAKCLLEEEKTRHNRIVTSIKVEFSFRQDDTPQRSQSFNISSYDEFGILPDKVLQHIISTCQHDIKDKKFTLETLTFVMKDFVSSSPVILTDLAKQIDALIISKTPRVVHELRIQSKPCSLTPISKFANHFVSSFGSLGNGDYWGKNVVLPKIIPADQYKQVIGTDLAKDFQKATIISDHLGFYELKHRQFCQWLQEFQFMEKVVNGSFPKPEFIAFNGRLADTMQTPDARQYGDFGDWEMYAMNVGGIIFLWDEKKPQSAVGQFAYFGLGFEALLRQSKTSEKSTASNEFEHVYTVCSTHFGQHKLLVVHEIDGEDEDGNWVELRLMNKAGGYARIAKLRKLWASNTIAGVNKFIIGTRDPDGVLLDIKERTIGDIETELDWRVDACLHFQNRLLSWIKSHFPVGNRQMVNKYSWVCGSHSVNCQNVPQQQIQNLVVPRLYHAYFDQLEKYL